MTDIPILYSTLRCSESESYLRRGYHILSIMEGIKCTSVKKYRKTRDHRRGNIYTLKMNYLNLSKHIYVTNQA